MIIDEQGGGGLYDSEEETEEEAGEHDEEEYSEYDTDVEPGETKRRKDNNEDLVNSTSYHAHTCMYMQCTSIHMCGMCIYLCIQITCTFNIYYLVFFIGFQFGAYDEDESKEGGLFDESESTEKSKGLAGDSSGSSEGTSDQDSDSESDDAKPPRVRYTH